MISRFGFVVQGPRSDMFLEGVQPPWENIKVLRVP